MATVFLVRMYSLFHDLTHNSLFESRGANRRWGHLLGFLLFTPYRWWQRQHSLHHAHTGNLDHRGLGEIYTMTLAEYERASLPAPARLPRLSQPAADAARRADPRLPVRAPLPPARHVAADPASVVVTNLALAGWAVGWSALVGWQTFLLIQGTTLVAGGAIAAWMLYIQHQYEDTYYKAARRVGVRARRAAGQLLPRAAARARLGRRQRQLPPRPPPQREDPELPPARRPRGAADVRAHAGRHVRSGIAALRLKLWDEESGSLVPFRGSPNPGDDARRGVREDSLALKGITCS